MAFAKEYKEEITLAYYCCNVALTAALFIIGTIYLWHRDRRDQQRESWRQFAQTIRSEYSQLKTKNIPSKILKVKDTFENIQIHMKITELDVLRYMINHDDYRCRFKTTKLDALREDLNSIFQLLSHCASVILLGKVPNNIRDELKITVTKLGEMTLPFYKGEERRTVLKCLKHFGSGVKPAVEEEVTNVDTELENGELAYIQYLRFCGHPAMQDTFGIHSVILSRQDNQNYTECSKLRLTFDDLEHKLVSNLGEPFNFLKKLQEDLQNEEYLLDFASELRKHLKNLKYMYSNTEKKTDFDSDKLVLVKVLHEVRTYISLILEERDALDADIGQNVEILRDVVSVTEILKNNRVIVRQHCGLFIPDLYRLAKSDHPYHQSDRFKDEFVVLYHKFLDLQVIKTNTDPSPPNLTERNTEENSYQRLQYVTTV